LGLLAYQDGNLEQARDSFERAEDCGGLTARRWWYLGQVYCAQGQKEKALEAFQQAVRTDSHFGAAYLEGGRILLDLGRPKEAAPFLARLTELEPRNPQARYLLALTYLLSWNTARAWEQYSALQEMETEWAVRLARWLEKTP
jgi:tetratricopeptide (TPR) repeat protein